MKENNYRLSGAGAGSTQNGISGPAENQRDLQFDHDIAEDAMPVELRLSRGPLGRTSNGRGERQS